MVLGTSSPSQLLNIEGATSPAILVTDTTNTTSLLLRSQNNTSSVGTSSNHPLVLETNGTERARINSDGSCRWTPDGTTQNMTLDASGNLLVGTTDTTLYNNTTGGGAMLSNSGCGFAKETSGTGDPVAYFNNTGDDGQILDFRKDGTTVGSINTAFGYMAVGTDDTGISFRNDLDSINPFTITGNTNRDAAIDLGASATRFKDLYLSGGVQYGTTGAAAELLDDYEEGTWNPDVAGSTTAGTSSFTFRHGTYTKVGNIVTVVGYYRIASATGTGDLHITGLPFTVESGAGNYAVVTIGETINLSHTSGTTLSGYALPSNAKLAITQIDYTGTGTSTSLVPIDAAHDLLFQCVYRAA